MVGITANYLDELKILPRLAFLCQIVLTWKVCLWFMTLEDPTTQQSAFVSLVTAMLFPPLPNFARGTGVPRTYNSTGRAVAPLLVQGGLLLQAPGGPRSEPGHRASLRGRPQCWAWPDYQVISTCQFYQPGS